jgi:hypothetical protein
MLIVALPLLRVAAAEVKLPLVSVAEPVGVGLPVPPLTEIATVNACAVVILDEDGVNATVGVDLAPAAVAVPSSVIVWVAPVTLSELSVNVREPEIAPAVVGAKLI